MLHQIQQSQASKFKLLSFIVITGCSFLLARCAIVWMAVNVPVRMDMPMAVAQMRPLQHANVLQELGSRSFTDQPPFGKHKAMVGNMPDNIEIMRGRNDSSPG